LDYFNREWPNNKTVLKRYLFIFLILLTAAFSVKAAAKKEKTNLHSPPTGLPPFVYAKTVVLNQIKDNASGLTWDKQNNRLVAVVNHPPEIHFFTPDVTHIQTVKLKNFSDTEAISHINGNLFAIVNECRMNIVLALIDSNTKTIDAENLPQIRIADKITNNKGVEGLTYDPSTSSFFVVREKSPKMIYQIRMKKWPGSFDKNAQMEYDIKPAWKLPFFSYWLRDFSGIHLDYNTGHFLILSDESKAIAEVEATGKFRRLFTLKELFQKSVPQPEGIVISPDRRLYILSEPHLLYIFNSVG
jgi:uncharacterized protein YjiK